jgi:predicted regulator of Ras-like GTPase activity (Roadblock/LC7/MglB family)
MIRLKVLPQVLGQANSDGVQGTVLLTYQGSIVSSVEEEGSDKAKVVAAIVANLFEAFADKATAAPEYMLYDCEHGRICVRPVADKLLLCLYGDDTVAPGMLKAKTHAVEQHLAEPLSRVTIE